MKVFISWSGKLSRDVAEMLRQYIPCIIQDIDVFMSKHDIESGERWGLQLANELSQSYFGIICLTPENINQPWILFEAGALTKHIEGRACGLLLGKLSPTDFSGPLSQFQNLIFEKKEIAQLFKDINNKISSPLSEGNLTMIFDKWWPDIEKRYSEILCDIQNHTIEAHKRNASEMVEEILLIVRDIQRNSYQNIERQHVKQIERNIIRRAKKYQYDEVFDSLSPSGQQLLIQMIVMNEKTTSNSTIEDPAVKEDIGKLQEIGVARIFENRLYISDNFIQYLTDKLRA